MISITTAEFRQLREAIACAHIFLQSFRPLFPRLNPRLEKQQRALLTRTPDEVARAFATLAKITQRENADPDDPTAARTMRLGDIDTKIMRNDLENVSALAMPDLVYEMQCACRELPGLNIRFTDAPDIFALAATLMAFAWEAGRRYGLTDSIAILDATITEFGQGTLSMLENCLNKTLELPPPELPLTPADDAPFKPGPRGDDGPGQLSPRDGAEPGDPPTRGPHGPQRVN